MATPLPDKITEQLKSAGLPSGGSIPFRPKLTTNRAGKLVVDKRAVGRGPKSRTKGWVDDQGRVWIRDRGHAGMPDHWDVQINDGADYIRVGQDGEPVGKPGAGAEPAEAGDAQ